MSSVIVGQPFDTVKVRLQTNPAYKSAFDVIKQAMKSEDGLRRSLFKGMAPPLVTATAVNAIVFTAYGWSTRTADRIAEDIREAEEEFQLSTQLGWDPNDGKQYSGSTESQSEFDESIWGKVGVIRSAREGVIQGGKGYEFWKNFCCGSFAGLIQCVVICPTEHIKCRLQASNAYSGPMEASKSIYASHGVSGIFRGWWTTCLREVPSFGLYFSCYDLGRDGLVENIPTLPNWASSVLAGGVSGSITWAMVYPIDIAKSVIQTLPMDTPLKERKCFNVIKDIVRRNGPAYLFRGLGVTILRAFPVNGMIFPVYELCIYGLTTPQAEWRFKDVF